MTRAVLLSLLMLSAAPALAGDDPVRLEPGTISTSANEYNFNMTADGSLAVFARSGAGFADAKIMVMERAGGGWTEPRPIAFSDPRWKDSDPWLMPDGSAILFASTRPTASRPDKTDLDIWMARRTADGWAAPEHLGDTVNSTGQELGPELHGDILYFNSTRPGGPGTLDIHMSRRVGGVFQTAVPLPAPVNSAAQEGDFTLTPDGTRAFFWSMRDGPGKLFTAVREGGDWVSVQALPDSINRGDFQFTPQVGHDGTSLYFAGTAPQQGQPAGMADIYETTLPGAGVLPGALPVAGPVSRRGAAAGGDGSRSGSGRLRPVL